MCAVPYHSWKQMFLPWEEGVQAGGAAVTRVSCRASGDNGPRLHVTGLRGGRGCGARKATNTALSGEVAEPGGPGAVTCLLQRGLQKARGVQRMPPRTLQAWRLPWPRRRAGQCGKCGSLDGYGRQSSGLLLDWDGLQRKKGVSSQSLRPSRWQGGAPLAGTGRMLGTGWSGGTVGVLVLAAAANDHKHLSSHGLEAGRLKQSHGALSKRGQGRAGRACSWPFPAARAASLGPWPCPPSSKPAGWPALPLCHRPFLFVPGPPCLPLVRTW